MAFSGALALSDLNDFLGPSQACIKPVEQSNALPELSPEEGAAATEIRLDRDGSYYEAQRLSDTVTSASAPRPRTKLETAQITLNDCLACSGCVTSAESVLITMQSHEEVYKVAEANKTKAGPPRVLVASISPQSLSSLSARYGHIPLPNVFVRVSHFLKTSLGFTAVQDTTFARHIALVEHELEFFERQDARAKAMEKGKTNAEADAEAGLPMLASACPGWICYAEKTHGELLPFISKTKSPQQIAGTLVKEWMARKIGLSPNQVYHVTVMPCYDKKLEASRQDFYNDVFATRDVDCVLTTGELDLMMREHSFDLSLPYSAETEDIRRLTDGVIELSVPAAIEQAKDTRDESASLQISTHLHSLKVPSLVQHAGTSSGSYLFSLMYSALRRSLSVKSDSDSFEPEVKIKTIRTSDFTEYTLSTSSTTSKDAESGSSRKIIFRGARVYGFRNLQNLVRKVGKQTGVSVGRGPALQDGRRRGGMVRRGRTADAAKMDDGYDYVEVMACPSGCVNGGGQLRPVAADDHIDPEGFQDGWARANKSEDVPVREPVGGWQGTAKEWVVEVEKAYWSIVPSDAPGSVSVAPDDIQATTTSALLQSRPPHLTSADNIAAQVIEEILQSVDDDSFSPDKERATRHRLFRTQYRAIQSEEVNGLAVKW